MVNPNYREIFHVLWVGEVHLPSANNRDINSEFQGIYVVRKQGTNIMQQSSKSNEHDLLHHLRIAA